MVLKKTDVTTYLLRDVPKSTWAKVKAASYNRNMSIRDWLMEAIDGELRREKDGKKGN